MLFADSAEASLFPTITRCWTRKGTQRVVEAPGVHAQKRYAFGAVEPQRGRVVLLTHARRNNVGFRRLLAAILRTYGTASSIVLFVDNASEHRAGSVKQLVAKYPAITLEFLPSYAPELNAQEQIWQQMRRSVTHNHYFAHLAAMEEALGQFYKELEQDPQWVKRLLKKWAALIST